MNFKAAPRPPQHAHHNTTSKGATKHNTSTPAPKHQTKSGSTTFRSHTATQAASGRSSAVRRSVTSYEPPLPKPKATPAPAPSASTAAASTNDASTWQRADSDRVDRGVVRAFATDLKKAGQSAGFPALLVAVMVIFLLVQHRLDNRDAKLSHADWASDHGLEFSAPSTIPR